MPHPSFNEWPDVYEAMIDWPKRLANETPFYRWLFDQVGAKLVLDSSCGTGRHAALFASWGLAVEGADLAPEMLRRCREKHGESDTLRWSQRSFTDPHPQPGHFDVAMCIGNSLALVPDLAAVAIAIRQLLAAVRPGGLLLIHVLNLWRLPDGPCLWQKCLRANLPQGDSLIVKGVHRTRDRGHVDLLLTQLSTNPPTLHTDSVPFLGLEAPDLERMARQAGATTITFFGDHARRPYERTQSQDLIMLASK